MRQLTPNLLPLRPSPLPSQLERFACLYTSHVSNLAFYSPEKSYRGRMDYMAHDDLDCRG